VFAAQAAGEVAVMPSGGRAARASAVFVIMTISPRSGLGRGRSRRGALELPEPLRLE